MRRQCGGRIRFDIFLVICLLVIFGVVAGVYADEPPSVAPQANSSQPAVPVPAQSTQSSPAPLPHDPSSAGSTALTPADQPAQEESSVRISAQTTSATEGKKEVKRDKDGNITSIKFDSDGDGFFETEFEYGPDGEVIRVWVYDRTGMKRQIGFAQPEKGTRKRYDRNHDGKVELEVVLDEHGAVVTEIRDTDGDGRMDEEIFYDWDRRVRRVCRLAANGIDYEDCYEEEIPIV